ncbi:uncharacterized protein A4U43_C08F22760 [Asparagus officinalis]|nr:uncharacterized protein A4U43_C08F22760 [Asparagus officinalis]
MNEFEISIDVLGRRPGYLNGYRIYLRRSLSTRSIAKSAEQDAEELGFDYLGSREQLVMRVLRIVKKGVAQLTGSNLSPSLTQISLAPADDIFFHGHLLPLHLRSHPRPSTDISVDDITIIPDGSHPINLNVNNKKNKPISLSSLLKLTKWLEDKKKHFLKKFFSKEEKHKRDLQRRPYSFSGNSNRKEKWISRIGEFSAPASMRTSPTNSGLLPATPPGYSSSNESSMEELQNAIQAAIAHCKNSSATKERQVEV